MLYNLTRAVDRVDRKSQVVRRVLRLLSTVPIISCQVELDTQQTTTELPVLTHIFT